MTTGSPGCNEMVCRRRKEKSQRPLRFLQRRKPQKLQRGLNPRPLQISAEARFSWQRTTEETETKGRGAARSGRLTVGLALCFGILALVARSLCGRVILHAVFQGTDTLTQTLTQLRQFPGTEHQQRNKEDHY